MPDPASRALRAGTRPLRLAHDVWATAYGAIDAIAAAMGLLNLMSPPACPARVPNGIDAGAGAGTFVTSALESSAHGIACAAKWTA